MQKKIAFGRQKSKSRNNSSNKVKKTNISQVNNVPKSKVKKGNKRYTKKEKRLCKYYSWESEQTEPVVVIDAETDFDKVAKIEEDEASSRGILTKEQYKQLSKHYDA